MPERITSQSDCFNELAILFDSYRVFYGKLSDLKQAKRFLKARINNNESVVYITRDDKAMVTGFVQLYPLFSSTQMQGIWLLNDLFVGKVHRGKGYSRQLIAASKEHCKETNYSGLMLETEINNTVANSLYRATEFKLDTQHNFYYWNSSE